MSSGYGYFDCFVCGAKDALLIWAESKAEPHKTLECSECGFFEEHREDTTTIGFCRENDSDLIPELFRKAAELMEQRQAEDVAQQHAATEGAIATDLHSLPPRAATDHFSFVISK